MPVTIGIHDLSVATTHYVLDHATLARHHGVDIDKYHYGIGQEAMSVAAADEDIVTMAAAAAAPILDRHGTNGIRTVLLATESGVDQAKAPASICIRSCACPTTAGSSNSSKPATRAPLPCNSPRVSLPAIAPSESS